MTITTHPKRDSPNLPLLKTAIPGPRSLEFAGRLAAVESPDTTYFSKDFPIFWDSALGALVTDADGNRYIDMNAGFGAAAVGHAHMRVVHALRRQSARLIHGMGDVHPTEVKLRLAEELVRLMPAGETWKTIFGTTGSDAIEAAMKTAAITTGKPGLIVFRGGYHGLSIGAMAATAWPKFHEGLQSLVTGNRAAVLPFPGMRDPDPSHDPISEPFSSSMVLDQVRATLDGRTRFDTPIGAVLIEPILGRGGIVVPPAGFLQGLRAICDEFGVLLILDEIFTGMGRTGHTFAFEHEGVTPDLIAIGKALGGGMPISVCIGKSRIIDAWGPSQGEARHTSTFLGHPLACAAALAVLQILEDEDLATRAASKGNGLLTHLMNELGDEPAVSAFRGRGLMVGVEIVNPNTGKPDAGLAWSCVVEALKRGVILLVAGMEGNVISLTPPLTIEDDQMEHAAAVLSEALKSARR